MPAQEDFGTCSFGNFENDFNNTPINYTQDLQEGSYYPADTYWGKLFPLKFEVKLDEVGGFVYLHDKGTTEPGEELIANPVWYARVHFDGFFGPAGLIQIARILYKKNRTPSE